METLQPEKQETTAPVLSANSSPSHEFSFTLSLHTSQTATATGPAAPEKTKTAPFAIDLSPADDIFFHGHLLPLHFLSHLHASSSPRSSTSSLDDITLSIKDLSQEQKKPLPCTDHENHTNENEVQIGNHKEKEGVQNSCKSKPFSLFSIAKWKKPSVAKETSDDTENQHQHQHQHQQHRRNKLKFEVSQFLKRYLKMVKPLISTYKAGREERREKIRVRRQSYSFSGALTRPRDDERGGRRGEFSAPASMRTSPTNSGLLLATAGVPSPSSDSTMEELQAAIQAAIAHCKNSISTDEKPVN